MGVSGCGGVPLRGCPVVGVSRCEGAELYIRVMLLLCCVMMLCCVVLCYVMLFYVMSCCVVLVAYPFAG